jgi:hypothetical protein
VMRIGQITGIEIRQTQSAKRNMPPTVGLSQPCWAPSFASFPLQRRPGLPCGRKSKAVPV